MLELKVNSRKLDLGCISDIRVQFRTQYGECGGSLSPRIGELQLVYYSVMTL